MSKFVEKIFSVQGDEKKTVLLLLVYSFFMGAAIAIFYTSTTSLILNRFDSSILPYAYIVGGIIVYLLSEFNRILQTKYKLSSVLLINIGFLLISTLIFIIINYLTGNKWMIFLLFVWVRVFTFIHGVSFWAIAVKIFDLRQGKRLFGLISSGEVLAAIISQFSIPLLLNVIKTEDLLYIGIVEIALSVFFIGVIGKKLKHRLDGVSTENVTNLNTNYSINNDQKKKAKNKIKIFFENKYNSYIFLLALLPMFGIYFADYIFFTQSKEVFADKEVLTRFLGIFLGFSAVLELTIKSLLTGRLVSKYGMKVGLLALPAMLLLGFGLPSIIGTIAGQGILFFSFISAGRLFMRIVRVGINDPVFQILYQPIDKNIRTKFQNQVEGQPKALGNIIAGLVLIVLTSLTFINILHITYFYVAVILVWLRVALNMYKEYRRKVREELNFETTNSDSSIGLVDLGIKQSPEYNFPLNEEIQWINNLLKLEPANYDSMYFKKISSVEKPQKIEILKYIIKEKLPLLRTIKNLYVNENDEEMKRYYLKTLRFLNSQAEISIKELEMMAHSDNESLIYECSRWVGYSKRYKSYSLLEKLIEHYDERVVKSALLSAGISGRKEIFRILIDHLFQKKFTQSSYEGLLLFQKIDQINELVKTPEKESQGVKSKDESISSGGAISSNVPTEEKASSIRKDSVLSSRDIEYLTKNWSSKKDMKKIIRALGVIGGKNSIKWLRDKINFNDYEVRYLITEELIKIGYKCSSTETSIVQELIEKEVRFIIWLICSKRDIENAISKFQNNSSLSDDRIRYLHFLMNSLDNDMFEKKDAIFNLLSLIYNPRIISVAKERIEEGGSESKAFGLEMLEMTLNEGLKELLISLFDIGLTKEAIDNYKFRFPELELSLNERLEDIMMKDFNEVNRWTKVCAIECLEMLPEEGIKLLNIISGLIFSRDKMISETSLICLKKLDNRLFERLTKNAIAQSSWDGFDKNVFANLVAETDLIEKEKATKITESIRKIGQLDLFKNLPERYRVYLVDNSELIKLKKDNELISIKFLKGNNLYIILEGELKVIYDKTTKDNELKLSEYSLFDNDLIFSSDFVKSFPEGGKFVANKDTEILKIDYDYISEFNIFWKKENLFEKIALKLLNQNRN